jgi:PQQ-dependent dehydrogenase (s-GDH family)
MMRTFLRPKPIFSFLLLCWTMANSYAALAQELKTPEKEDFNIRVVASALSDPWEVTYGPDAHLWVTESKAYRVLRINTSTGKKQVLLDLSNKREFPRYDQIPDEQDGGKPWPQGGLTGMALHPSMLKGKPYVYLAYAYRFAGAKAKGDGGEPAFKGYHYVTRIVRYNYDLNRQQLINPVTLCDSIPASSDHNGGRLIVAPQNGKPFLFYSIGDMGAGQFANGGRQNKAQNISSYEGKILRFNLETDSDVNLYDKWIPNDNPFNKAHQSAVWSFGHRNPQGLAYININGKDLLYSCEHGPYGDDEINIIHRAGNYGHPLIIGYNDGNYDGMAASVSNHQEIPGPWHTSYPLITSERNNAEAIGAAYRDPERSLFSISHDRLKELFNKLVHGEDQDWEAYGPSSVDIYTGDAVPGWKNSLLMTTLKGAALLRIKMDDNGKLLDEKPHTYVKGKVRYRDLAISTDGSKIYLATDSSSVSSGPSKENPKEVSYRGSILELTYKQ